MRGWQHHLQLKDVLDHDDVTPAVVASAAEEIYGRLEKFRLEHYPKDDDLDSISDHFHTIAIIDGPENADVVEFNTVMNALYDWADFDKRLWVE